MTIVQFTITPAPRTGKTAFEHEAVKVVPDGPHDRAFFRPPKCLPTCGLSESTKMRHLPLLYGRQNWTCINWTHIRRWHCLIASLTVWRNWPFVNCCVWAHMRKDRISNEHANNAFWVSDPLEPWGSNTRVLKLSTVWKSQPLPALGFIFTYTFG